MQKEKLEFFLAQYTKINSRWIIDQMKELNYRKIRSKSLCSWVRENLLKYGIKSTRDKEKEINWIYFIKLKTLVHQNIHSRK